MTTDALREHYTRVADASPVPVLLYTIPKYMHFALPRRVVRELARHENIVGMKDSSGDATLFARLSRVAERLVQGAHRERPLLGEALRWARTARSWPSRCSRQRSRSRC